MKRRRAGHLRATADLMAALDHVAFAGCIKPKAFSRATVGCSRDAAGSAAAACDLAGIIHRTICEEPYDIGTDHNGRDQKRNFGLPIHGLLVACAALRFEQVYANPV